MFSPGAPTCGRTTSARAGSRRPCAARTRRRRGAPDFWEEKVRLEDLSAIRTVHVVTGLSPTQHTFISATSRR